MKAMLIMNIIVLVFGAYMLYMSVSMKKTGRIPSMILAPEELKKCKDEKSFTAFLSPKLLVVSLVFMAVGAISLLEELLIHTGWISYVAMLVFLAAFFLFTRALQDARAKFIK